MALAKYFEERIERFLGDCDDIQKELSETQNKADAEFIEYKSNRIRIAMSQMVDELLGICTKPEYQDALFLEELSQELDSAENEIKSMEERLKDRETSLMTKLSQMRLILEDKDQHITTLSDEINKQNELISKQQFKISEIHTYYKQRENKNSPKVEPEESPSPNKEKPKEPTLSFRELLEQSAQEATIADKRK